MDLVFIAKILILAVFITGIIIFFGKIKKKNKLVVAGLCVIAVIASFISNAIVSVIPMPKDTVQLTATGEKNPKALNNEVSLKAVIVDGIQYEIQNAVEGKWFWQGNNYMWRNENDSRKPDGVTPSVTLEVPKGNDRKFVFSNNQYRGIVEISCNGESETHDLYSEQNADVNIGFSGNGLAITYMIKLGRLALYALFIALILAYFAFVSLKYDYDVIKAWFGRNWDKIFYAFLSFFYLFMLHDVSKEGSFFADEVWILGWLYTKEWPKEQVGLFSYIYNWWFDIMPYGQEYMRLLGQLFVAASIYLAGLIGRNYKSKRFGIMLSSTVAFSLSVIYQCSFVIRSYGAMFFTTTLMFYMFIRKQKKLDNPKIIELLIYGLSIVLAMDTHLMSIMTAGLLMIADFILIILRKTSKKGFIEFLFPAIYGIYWITSKFIAFMHVGGVGEYSTWMPKLTFGQILDFVKWVFSYNNIMVFLFIMGFVYIVVSFIFNKTNKKQSFNQDYTALTFALVPFLQITIIAIYSFFIAPDHSMLIERYFVSIFICMFFVFVTGFDKVAELTYNLSKNLSKKMSANIVVTTAAVCTMTLYCVGQVSPWNPWPKSYRSDNRNFKAAAEYVMRQNDCYSSSTIFVLDHINSGNIGIQYYTTHKGERDDINHISIGSANDISKYNTIYISYVWHGDRQNGKLNSVIDEQYELVSNDKTAKVKKYVRKSN